jgi:hypothetical protein
LRKPLTAGLGDLWQAAQSRAPQPFIIHSTMTEDRILIDLSVIDELADGDPIVMAELIEAFRRHTLDGIAKVRAAIARSGFSEAAQSEAALAEAALIVHTCIGFTATLGITTMLPALRELERASKDRDAGDMLRSLARWEQEFEQILRSLLAHLEHTRTL